MPKNMLNGKTILRFAHAFETGGGVERYLEDVDRALLERNSMTIIRLHLAADRRQLEEKSEFIGRGQLIKVPLPLPENETIQSAADGHDQETSWKRMIRDWVLYNPVIWRLGVEKAFLNRPIRRRKGQVIGAGEKVAQILRRQPVDLVVLHFMGGGDSDEIVQQARRAGIPFVVVNHFSNDRFAHLSIRKHATMAAAVAGVNGLDLPGYVREKFYNVSDGVDVDFFQTARANPPAAANRPPQILLPARMTRAKGHLDLVRAAQIVKREGAPFRIGFAGRTDSEAFLRQLRAEITQLGLEGEVEFLGALPVEKLRDVYGESAMLALPTYHHEGLPRCILEAQAMKLPVVAYATGGLAEGVAHGESGYLLDTGDVPGLAARLDQLLRRPELRQRMGEAGRQLVEQRFSLEALAVRHENLYGKFLRKEPKTVPALKLCPQN